LSVRVTRRRITPSRRTEAVTKPPEAVKEAARQNPFLIVQQQLDECAAMMELPAAAHTILRQPHRELHAWLPVRMDDGTVRTFEAFRVQYNDALGPTKGGIRFHPEETADTVRALAAWMTWKCSLLGLPLGGAKGGVICNPKELSKTELERLSRAYVRAVWKFIGPEEDIPAPDVYTDPQVMAWMMDEYSRIVGKNQFGVVTGKPVQLGGSLGRGDATARGGMYVLRVAAGEIGLDLSGATVAVQGYGNAGYHAARLAASLFRAKVVAVSDSKGGILSRTGLDPEAVLKHKVKTGSVVGFPGAKTITNDELLELDVSVLCPAALENVITARNAANVKCKILCELANGPTTPEADGILYRNGVHVLPDFLASAGGVTVSYFEMVQNFAMSYWDEQEIHKMLEKRMTNAYHAVLDLSRKRAINMRQAAYIVAVERVVEAMRLRGWL
jgi:glutamate dehydrogenase (NAD(P)+)